MAEEERTRSVSEADLEYLTARGRFLVKKLLGRGGMGDVYLAEDRRLHRLVALKTMRADLSSVDEMRKRVRRECRLHARIGPHPHIVTLFDRFRAEGHQVLVMEYVEGMSLREWLERYAAHGQALSPRDAMTIAIHCLSALSRIHALGIVHRDIKPDNIILAKTKGERLRAKLMDFGIAKIDTGEGSHLTQEGTAPGTPTYMAPEQFDTKGFGPISPATDIYAVGVMLYQMIAGAPPFEGTIAETLSGHLITPPPPLCSPSGAHVSRRLVAAVNRALAKRPEERYQSAKAFRKELRGLVNQLRGDRAGAEPPATDPMPPREPQIHLDDDSDLDTPQACAEEVSTPPETSERGVPEHGHAAVDFPVRGTAPSAPGRDEPLSDAWAVETPVERETGARIKWLTLGCVTGAVVLVCFGAVLAATRIWAYMEAPDVAPAPVPAYDNKALALLARGAPTAEALRAAVDAVAALDNAQNRSIVDDVRERLAQEVHSLLNTAEYSEENLLHATAIAYEAAAIDGKSEAVQALKAEVEEENYAYRRMTVVHLDPATETVTFRLIYPANPSEEREVTVKRDEMVRDRFIVRRITEDYVRLEDTKRHTRLGQNRLFRLTRTGAVI